LAYRDLLVGGFLNLWSVPGLIDVIKQRRPELFNNQNCFPATAIRHVKEFLEKSRDASGLDLDDINSLV